MTDPTTPVAAASRRWLSPVLWVAGSFIAFVLLFFDPIGLHPLDGWLQARLGVAPATSAAGEVAEREILFYRHPMDPTITSPAPAKDEMGMGYIPVYADEAAGQSSGERNALFYRHPMDPTITSQGPAKDEMGMDYIPVYADEAGGPTGGEVVVAIDPVMVQNMNVQTAEVRRQDLEHAVRTVGYLEYDQERMVTVTTKYSGWVEKVYVNYVGEPVKKGQPLFEVYSPELVQTEQELLSARAYAARLAKAPDESRRRAEALLDAARTRLSYWDVSPEQVAELESSGVVFRTLQVVAPASGLVMKRMAGLEGMAVRPGMETYHIADLSTLWLSVEVFEDHLALIREGTPAEVTLTYFPGEVFRGLVRFIEPEFSQATRTLRVKIEVPNRGGRLRSGMFATVRLFPPAAKNVLTVPSQSVLRTGERNVVVLALGDGRFAPREVILGHEMGGVAEVLDGLVDGQRIVTSAQFLLDSEASLQEALQKMIAQSRGATDEPAAQPSTDAHDSDPRDSDPRDRDPRDRDPHDMDHQEMDHEGMDHEGSHAQ